VCFLPAAPAGRHGELQAAGAGGAAVSEWPAGPRGGDAQPGHLPHGAAAAAGGQSAAARGHPAVQHPAGAVGGVVESSKTSFQMIRVNVMWTEEFKKCSL